MLSPDAFAKPAAADGTSNSQECCEDSSGEHDDNGENSVENKNQVDDYFESPLQSLETQYLNQQRSYASRFLEQGISELLCCDVDFAEQLEMASKTIKAATIELSSPQIQHKRPLLTRALSLSAGDLMEIEGTAGHATSSSSEALTGQAVLSPTALLTSYSVRNLLNNSEILQHGLGKIWNYYLTELTDSVKCHSDDGTKLEAHEPLHLPTYTSYGVADGAHADHASPTSPTERQQFFKMFLRFVRHSQTSQEKKLQNVVCCEDDVTLKTLRYFIWMELLAWHKSCGVDDMENILNLKRQTILSTVEAVLNFTIKFSKQSDVEHFVEPVFQLKEETSNAGSSVAINRSGAAEELLQCDTGYESGHGSLPNFIDDSESGLPSLKNMDTICDCSDTLSRLCQNCVDQETAALHQVEAVLAAVENIENLYPSLQFLSEHAPVYRNKKFACRLKTLHAWVNLTKDLRQKVDMLGKLFGIKDRKKVGWPCYEAEGAENIGSESPVVNYIDVKSPAGKLQLRNLSSDFSSPSTSGSDKSEKSKSSIPSSPDIHMSDPFNLPQVPFYPSSTVQRSRSIYHKYVDYTLRHHGLKKMYRRLFTPLRPVLYRVHAVLKKPKLQFSPDVPAKFVTGQLSANKTLESALPVRKEYLDELSSVGVWSECFQSMGLPTFHKPFFFLLRVFLDVMHECMCLRLEQQPSKPSVLSVGQLIKECKEVLRAASQTRQKYINLAQTVLGEGGNEIIEAQLDSYDDDSKKMLQVYLEYLQHSILIMSNVSQTTLHQKSYLEEEWSFVRAICPHIPGGEALAAKKFCFMASSLLHSIGTCLTIGVSEQVKNFNAKDGQDYREQSMSRKCRALQTYREIKHIFQDLSERSRQVITLAKSLRKDLEIAAEFSLLVPTSVFLAKLKETGHIRVIAPHTSGHVMFVPGNLQHCEMLIWQLVDMTCGHESLDLSNGDKSVYLVMMQCSRSELKGLIWDGPTIILEPTAEANITLSHVEVDGVLLVVNHSSQLAYQCEKFQKSMGETLKVDKQQTSCNHAIADALSDLKSEALELWDVLTSAFKQVEENLDIFPLSDLDESDQASLLSSYREVLHQGYRFAFEYQKEVMRLITGEARNGFYASLARFGEQWMKFVIEKCEEGRGLRAMWAKQGLEFLIAVYDSPYGHNMPEEEFEVLQRNMNNCIRHLLGCVEKSPLASHALNSPKTGFFQRFPFHSRNWRSKASLSISSSDSVLSSSPLSSDDSIKRKRSRDEGIYDADHKLLSDHDVSPMESVRRKLEMLEKSQDDRLLEKGVIGRVSDVKIERMPLHVSARRVTFPWQRCFKIGEGRFGKVYTAVNNSTGELIAMKEIHLQPNDHRAIKEALDEIRTFEGIKHPNLVRYYGVEVHREEMLIFMEYCNEGSLESAAQLHLPESLIRKYTRQLLEAVNVLHEHNIVHRDIKSANIFLTSSGELKLGDFGCCIKLKNNTTMPGELCGFVGTPAYMAPEVFTKNVEGGHGRAADVWSIGCVVLEMLTGKRPWHELENSYQIMFTVGMGGVPEIPEYLNEEAHDFLDKCLITNPKERWPTGQLLSHPFTKVPEDDYS